MRPTLRRCIAELHREAAEAGDLRQCAICVLALGGPGALEGADPGTEQHKLLGEGRTMDWAVTECLEALLA